jgi:hypothetical protein
MKKVSLPQSETNLLLSLNQYSEELKSQQMTPDFKA